MILMILKPTTCGSLQWKMLFKERYQTYCNQLLFLLKSRNYYSKCSSSIIIKTLIIKITNIDKPSTDIINLITTNHLQSKLPTLLNNQYLYHRIQLLFKLYNRQLLLFKISQQYKMLNLINGVNSKTNGYLTKKSFNNILLQKILVSNLQI